MVKSLLSKEVNYGLFFKKDKIEKRNYSLKVDFVKGFAMLLNLERVKRVNFFDENFFLYLEEIDLCKRLKNLGENIYVSTKAKVKHIGGRSSNPGFDLEINRNWHWMWSKIYYSSKHEGFIKTRLLTFPLLFKLSIKCLFYIFFLDQKKFMISFSRLRGSFAAFLNLKSNYRIKTYNNIS